MDSLLRKSVASFMYRKALRSGRTFILHHVILQGTTKPHHNIFEFLCRKKVGRALDYVTNSVNQGIITHIKRISCTISSSIYKNLKLRKKRRRKGSQQLAGGLI